MVSNGGIHRVGLLITKKQKKVRVLAFGVLQMREKEREEREF